MWQVALLLDEALYCVQARFLEQKGGTYCFRGTWMKHDETIAYALLAIHEPKTRHTGPRHQAAKLDAPDLLQVVDLDLAFGDRLEGSRLWEMSGQTLRVRFKELLRELQLPLEKSGDMKPLDLGSLRAGGATWHLQVTEDSEYCRRKGRWINVKTWRCMCRRL